MPGFGEPDWVNPNGNDNANVATVSEANTPGNITAPQEPKPSGGSKTLGLMGLSILGMCLSVMMTALGVLTLIEVHRNGLGDLSEPFLAVYMVMFAVLLFTYELMWWTPMPGVNKALRKNFGFLYGLRGKGLYLIFVACLCLGLGKDASVNELNWATGIAFALAGCLHLFVVCFHPEMAQKYVAPTAGLAGPEPTPNVV